MSHSLLPARIIREKHHISIWTRCESFSPLLTMEKPDQSRHLLRESVDYSAVRRKEPTEEEEESENDPITPRRRSFWRNRPWWQWLVLLQLGNLLVFTLLLNRKAIAHRMAKMRDPIASSCKQHLPPPTLYSLMIHSSQQIGTSSPHEPE